MSVRHTCLSSVELDGEYQKGKTHVQVVSLILGDDRGGVTVGYRNLADESGTIQYCSHEAFCDRFPAHLVLNPA